MASKKKLKKLLLDQARKADFYHYLLTQIVKTLFDAQKERVDEVGSNGASEEKREEVKQPIDLFGGHTPSSQQATVNGHDLSKVIRDNPMLSNTSIGAIVGVNHQFVTAWKRTHDDWKAEKNT